MITQKSLVKFNFRIWADECIEYFIVVSWDQFLVKINVQIFNFENDLW